MGSVCLTGCLESDEFDGLTDSPATDVEITFPSIANGTNPLITVTGNSATTPVGPIPIDVRILSRTGKVADSVWVDPSLNDCRGFTDFSYRTVLTENGTVYSGDEALHRWVNEEKNLGEPIRLDASGPDYTFQYTFNPDEFSAFFLGNLGLIGTGKCATGENQRIRFIVKFKDGTTAVSYPVRFRFTR